MNNDDKDIQLTTLMSEYAKGLVSYRIVQEDLALAKQDCSRKECDLKNRAVELVKLWNEISDLAVIDKK